MCAVSRVNKYTVLKKPPVVGSRFQKYPEKKIPSQADQILTNTCCGRVEGSLK